MDMIHGENSPLVKVTEEECEQKMDSLKNNMHRVFDYSLGRLSSLGGKK